MLCFRKVAVARNSRIRERAIKIFRPKSFVPQPRKLWQGNPFVSFFGKLPVANNSMDKRGRGVSRFSVERFFVSECRKFRRGKFLCRLSENFR